MLVMRTARHGTRSEYTSQGCRCEPCTKAQREYQRQWYTPRPKKPADHEKNKARQREYQKRRHEERRQKAIEILGGRCVECGCQDDLQFDHIDPSTKSHTVATMFASRRWALIEAELEKCQLLCFECHWRKTRVERSKISS